eukprot:TRINITY_DN5442_c1_g1_i1.p1 TRINITY_DN5442_c1_g1~~TRINITY_DN5442_c1_g1_i1.p1  ORF type:complete len:148 (+),score=28.93 TRINITY_DN5442_c1_g1_i1:71-514(+)
MRRVERLMLGTPLVPRTIAAIRIVGRPENPVATDWMKQWAPMLRYGNPNLVLNFRNAKIVEAPVPVDDEAADTSSLETKSAPSASGETDSSNVKVDVEEPEESEKEHIELEFTDGTHHYMNLAIYRQSHQVMQRIIDIDAEKGLSAG